MTGPITTRHSYEAVADDCGCTPDQVAQVVRWLTALQLSYHDDPDGTLEDVRAVVGVTFEQARYIAAAEVPT